MSVEYTVKIIPLGKGSPVEVTISANDTTQARKLAEAMYGGSKIYSAPVRKK